jgi:hypothetical protein
MADFLIENKDALRSEFDRSGTLRDLQKWAEENGLQGPLKFEDRGSNYDGPNGDLQQKLRINGSNGKAMDCYLSRDGHMCLPADPGNVRNMTPKPSDPALQAGV